MKVCSRQARWWGHVSVGGSAAGIVVVGWMGAQLVEDFLFLMCAG